MRLHGHASPRLQQFAIEGLRSLIESHSGEEPGSPAAVLRFMQEPPHVPASDVDDLEAEILAGRMPVRDVDLFTDPAQQ